MPGALPVVIVVHMIPFAAFGRRGLAGWRQWLAPDLRRPGTAGPAIPLSLRKARLPGGPGNHFPARK